MKNLLLIIFIGCALNSQGQFRNERVENTSSGFQKDRLFTGGNASVSFSNRYTVLGLSPVIGYSFTDWFDAGVSLNFYYTSRSDYSNYGDKLRETLFGPGAFVRIFPVNFLFAGAMYEYNSIRQKYISATSGTPDLINWYSSNSFLVGGGFSGGRENGGNSYYYLSVMWDIGGDPKSPYTDQFGTSRPIFRAGYNIGLFQGKRNR